MRLRRMQEKGIECCAWRSGIYDRDGGRNSDIVKMASYAPLFVNEHDRRWNPDAIVFNSETAYGYTVCVLCTDDVRDKQRGC